MKLFRKRFSPNLIDLVQYEKNLLYWREHNTPLQPPPAIPGLLGRWTDSEMQAMRDNRQAAQEIYDRINSIGRTRPRNEQK